MACACAYEFMLIIIARTNLRNGALQYCIGSLCLMHVLRFKTFNKFMNLIHELNRDLISHHLKVSVLVPSKYQKEKQVRLFIFTQYNS